MTERKRQRKDEIYGSHKRSRDAMYSTVETSVADIVYPLSDTTRVTFSGLPCSGPNSPLFETAERLSLPVKTTQDRAVRQPSQPSNEQIRAAIPCLRPRTSSSALEQPADARQEAREYEAYSPGSNEEYLKTCTDVLYSGHGKQNTCVFGQISNGKPRLMLNVAIQRQRVPQYTEKLHDGSITPGVAAAYAAHTKVSAYDIYGIPDRLEKVGEYSDCKNAQQQSLRGQHIQGKQNPSYLPQIQDNSKPEQTPKGAAETHQLKTAQSTIRHILPSAQLQQAREQLSVQEQWLRLAQPDLPPKALRDVPGIPPTHQVQALKIPNAILLPRNMFSLRSLTPQERVAKYNALTSMGRAMAGTNHKSEDYKVLWAGVVGMSTALVQQERRWYASFQGGDPRSQAQKNTHLQHILRKQALPTAVAKVMHAPALQKKQQPKGVITILSRSPSLASDRVSEKHSSPTGQYASIQSSPLENHGSPQNLVRKKKASVADFEEVARKRARSKELQAARDAKAEADDREYEENRETIDAYYLKGDQCHIRKASDPVWRKICEWRLRSAKLKPISQVPRKSQQPAALVPRPKEPTLPQKTMEMSQKKKKKEKKKQDAPRPSKTQTHVPNVSAHVSYQVTWSPVPASHRPITPTLVASAVAPRTTRKVPQRSRNGVTQQQARTSILQPQNSVATPNVQASPPPSTAFNFAASRSIAANQIEPPVESNSNKVNDATIKTRCIARLSVLETVHRQMLARKRALNQSRELRQYERIVIAGVDIVELLEANINPMTIVNMITAKLESAQVAQAQEKTQHVTRAGPQTHQLRETDGVQGPRRQASIVLPPGVQYDPWSSMAEQPQELIDPEQYEQARKTHSEGPAAHPWQITPEFEARPWASFQRDMNTLNEWDAADRLESACQIPQNQPFGNRGDVERT
ncbi:hypothetical protein BDU57DRAFT_580734 [Ampelomyces quisqualis]|uniref:Uncharacterized protein n=1 Tax=Ampelomyces quisqualis TaxID=50730 RepID=A0A6A5QHQ4_AMPQU|nr:hypothetical protein BDU57DRAFT_580734 [Ampelomyces quisqualis]